MAVNIIINESVEITVNEAGVPGPAGTGALDLVGYQVIRLGPLGGNANAMTGAIPSAFSGMSVVDDVVFSITALGDNTVTNPTLDIGDGSGPQVIRRSGGGTLDLGELKDGRVYLLVPKVSGGTITEFRLLNNSVSAEIADAAAVDDDDLSAVDKIGIKPATASGALRNVTTGNLFLWLWKYLASQGAKTDLDDTDVFGLSDSDDNSAPKRVSWASLKGAIWDAVGGLIAGGDAKTTPVATDLIPISDSGSASATKSVTLGDLWANFFQGQVGGSFATTEQGQRADEAARHLGTTTGTDGDLQLTVSGPIPQVFSFSPHVTNTGATNLTINGTTYSVQAAAGGSVPAGYLEQDVSYLVFRFSSTKVRVIGARTAGDVGLGNLDNTSDADKPLSLLDKDAHAAGGMFYIGNVTYDSVNNTYTGPTAYDPPFDEIPPGSGHRILMRVATGNENVAADPTLVIGGATRTLLDRNIKSIEAGRLLPGYYTVLLSGTDKAFVWQVMKPEDIGLGNVDNTADLDKPIQNAIKAATASSMFFRADSTAWDEAEGAYIVTLGDLCLDDYTNREGILLAFVAPEANTVSKPELAVGVNSPRLRMVDTDESDFAVGDIAAGHLYIFRQSYVNGVFRWKLFATSYDRERIAEQEEQISSLTEQVRDSAYVLRQVDNDLPERPDEPTTVLWACWDDPSEVMEPTDFHMVLPTPTAPEIVPSGAWRAWDQRNGGGIVVRLLDGAPNTNPPTLEAGIRVDGTTTYTMSDMDRDYFISGMTLGSSYDVELRTTNFVGNGPYSTPQTVTITDGDMVDDFTGYTSFSDGPWILLSSTDKADKISVSGGIMTVEYGSSRVFQMMSDAYYPADHFAEVTIDTPGTVTTNDRGFWIVCRAQEDGAGYGFRMTETYWQFGPTENRTTDPSTIKFYWVDNVEFNGTPPSFPLTFRVECQGTTITAKINGTVVAQITDDTYADGDVWIIFDTRGASNDMVLSNFAAGDL